MRRSTGRAASIPQVASEGQRLKSQPQPKLESEPEASDLGLAEFDVREQAALMAMFEARQQSAQEAAALAAAAAANKAAMQMSRVSSATPGHERHMVRSISAPAAAGTPEATIQKRQRTLRGFFSVSEAR